MRLGLVSVTFRKLSAPEIISLVRENGLRGIEWGGDVHVPHGNLKTAQEVFNRMQDAGLETASYGSYYRLANRRDTPNPAFAAVLETALALQTKTIRVWPGTMGSAEADSAYREQVAAETRSICDQAQSAGITISFEYHANTLTDTDQSALDLIQMINHPNLRTFWQPIAGTPHRQALQGLQQIIPWLSNVHVNHRDPVSKERALLTSGESVWREFLKIIPQDKNRWLLLEFTRGDSQENFVRDVASLKQWIEECCTKNECVKMSHP
jgi:3-dehydroshikimate dehydratase